MGAMYLGRGTTTQPPTVVRKMEAQLEYVQYRLHARFLRVLYAKFLRRS